MPAKTQLQLPYIQVLINDRLVWFLDDVPLRTYTLTHSPYTCTAANPTVADTGRRQGDRTRHSVIVTGLYDDALLHGTSTIKLNRFCRCHRTHRAGWRVQAPLSPVSSSYISGYTSWQQIVSKQAAITYKTPSIGFSIFIWTIIKLLCRGYMWN